MGNSMPPPAAFDLVDSFARLRGSSIELVLADAKLDEAPGAPSVILAKGKHSVTAAGELTDNAGTRHLVVRAPRASLSDGVWTIAVQGIGAETLRMEARLLVQADRPLVLLWGAKAGPTQAPSARTRKLASRGGRVLDRGLSVLPPQKAAAARAAIRRRARKILG
jgi:hypothetical protein